VAEERHVPSRVPPLWGAIAYGVLVFVGATGFGFVVMPVLGHASGRFPIEAEAEAVFSFLTLKGVPSLVGLSGAVALSYSWIAKLSAPRRVAVYVATVLLCWVAGAAVAAFLLS
jgi:hypothetical protein